MVAVSSHLLPPSLASISALSGRLEVHLDYRPLFYDVLGSSHAIVAQRLFSLVTKARCPVLYFYRCMNAYLFMVERSCSEDVCGRRGSKQLQGRCAWRIIFGLGNSGRASALALSVRTSISWNRSQHPLGI